MYALHNRRRDHIYQLKHVERSRLVYLVTRRGIETDLVLLAMVGVVGATVLGGRVVKAGAGYELVSMQQQVVQLTRDNEELSLEVAELKSPTRIQQIAQDKLGMVLPDAFVYNSKGTTVERDVKVTARIRD